MSVNISCDEDEPATTKSPQVWAGGESPAPIRNPSPPKELQGLSDNIGRTAFSKHWFFSTLMKLIEIIEKPKTEEDEEATVSASNEQTDVEKETVKGDTETTQADSGSNTAGSTAEPSTEDTTSASKCEDEKTSRIVDISVELQDDLCQLWDMCSDEDVAKLLQEYKAIEMLTAVISNSDAPRATEIAVGILGNMACTPSVCESMADCASLIDISLCLLTNSDAPTLVEATRFLSTVLADDKCREVWLEAWMSDAQYKENIIFILRSSVNLDLLQNTAHLLDKLLDISDQLCNSWSCVDLLTSVLEALRQLGLNTDEGSYSLLHCLQLMSTQSNGVSAIVDQVENVLDVLVEFLLKTCEDEIVNLEGTRSAGVASVISVLNIALTSSPASYSLLYSGEKCIRCLLKIIYACDKEVVILGTPKNSPSQSSGNSYLIKMLKEVLYHIIADTVAIMSSEEADVSQTDTEDDLSEKTTPSLLKYMNNNCERPRLHSVINLLLSHNGQQTVSDILDLCAKYDLDRLEKHILDYDGSTQ